MKRRFVKSIFILLALLGCYYAFKQNYSPPTKNAPIDTETIIPTLAPTITPTPTPRPLTFAEMNELYGPCAYVPTLMYHHIQDMEVAQEKNQGGLSVSPELFRKHLELLQTKGYTTISMQDLINFFDSGTPLPAKPIMLTFDDGYDDFAQNAVPLLTEFQAKATLFLPTGLVNNPDYLSWDTINSFPKNLILVANHTWSHANTQTSYEKVTEEIVTADTQLTERGLNSPKVFSYPYGLVGSTSQSILQANNYLLAFTTIPSSTLCKQKRLELPRVRIGNTSLSYYGF